MSAPTPRKVTREAPLTMDTFLRGLWRENPVFVMLLGMCPVLAITNTVSNALAMGLATTFVLVCSSVIVSLLRRHIPKEVRIASYIVIIATFVTVVDYIIQAVSLEVYNALGAFIQLIVANCMILGRQEAFASKHTVKYAVMDAVGMAGGFMVALFALGAVREILGEGKLFGLSLFGEHFEPWVIMILPPGGFITLGLLLLLFNWVGERKRQFMVQVAAVETGDR